MDKMKSELVEVSDKHAEALKCIRSHTEEIRTKSEELNKMKEHCLVLLGAKAVLEKLTKDDEDTK